jgi:hypothetical protein
VLSPILVFNFNELTMPSARSCTYASFVFERLEVAASS